MRIFNQTESRRTPILTVFLAIIVPMGGIRASVDSDSAVESRAEAYYQYCLAQRAQGEGDYQQSVQRLEKVLRADPNSPSVALELAEIYLLLGEGEKAKEALLETLEQDPENPQAHKLLADGYLRGMGEENAPHYVDRAIQEFQKAIELDGADEDGVLRLASLYLNLGRTREGIELLEDFREHYPGSLGVGLMLAKSYLQLGDLEGAEILLTNNLSMDPTHLESIELLADIFEDQEKFLEALQLYEELVHFLPANQYLFARLGYLNLLAKRYPESTRYLERARSLDPYNQSVLFNLAQAQEEAGDLPAARDVYRELLDLLPQNRGILYHLARLNGQMGDRREALRLFNDLVTHLEAQWTGTKEEEESATISYLQIGRLHMARGQIDPAVDAFRKAMKYSDGHRVDVYLFLTRAYLEGGKFSLALKTLDRGERGHPDEIAFNLLRGEILLRQGKTQEALRIFRPLWNDPETGRETLLRLAEILVTEKQFREAGNLLARTLDRFPRDDMIFFQLGALREREGNLEKAETHFREALEINPENPLVLNYLGYMYVDKGVRLKESLDYILQAVSFDRYNAAYLDSLGWAYFKLDHLESARKNLEAASRLSGGDPVIENHLGDLYHRLGRIEDALSAWQRCLDLGPEKPAAVRKKIDQATRLLEDGR